MDVIEKRMKTAAWEAQSFDGPAYYIVINDELQTCVEELHAIIQSEHKKRVLGTLYLQKR